MVGTAVFGPPHRVANVAALALGHWCTLADTVEIPYSATPAFRCVYPGMPVQVL